MRTRRRIGLLPQKLAAWIAGSVGTIGIFLAALGLYGLMAFLVAQRTREIAIRMALGASNRDMRIDGPEAGRLGWARSAGDRLALAGGIGTLAQRLLVGVPPIDPIVVRRNGAAVRCRPRDGRVDAGKARRGDGPCYGARASRR